jgi:uncharacterized protein YcbK (DUF882 family)
MAFRTIQTDDKILFFLSDTEVLELTNYDNVKKLVEASSSNLDQLIDEVKTKLVESVQEDLQDFDTEDVQILQKSLAYAKLLQVVNQYRYVEKIEAARKAEEEERLLNNNVWSWEK